MVDSASWEQQALLRSDAVPALAFGPDHRELAIGSVSRLVRLWSLSTSLEEADLPHGTDSPLLDVLISADGDTLASVGPDRVLAWDLAGTGERRELAGHDAGIPCVAFAPDGQTLLSTSKDLLAQVMGRADRIPDPLGRWFRRLRPVRRHSAPTAS